MHRLVKKTIRLTIPTLVIIVLAPMMTQRQGRHMIDKDYSCLICPEDTSSMGYPVGYSYEMLSTFAKEEGIKLEIGLWEDATTPIDTVFAHGTSMMAVPKGMADSLGDRYMASPTLANGTVWVTSEEDKRLGEIAGRWLSEFMGSPVHDTVVRRFTPHYEPFHRAHSHKTYPSLSPYDRLLKDYADSIGWDWRALAALVWQESKFRIEVSSSMGASGLMQMTKATARAHGVRNALDPEENMAAGARYIQSLEKIFRSRASGDGLMKLTLAAYNAGEGRILDCIHYAEAHGLPASTWEDIQAVLPAMRDSATIVQDTSVRLGVFKGYETERYISRMDTLTWAFRAISIEP